MRHRYGKPTTPLGVILFVSLLCLFPAAAPARAAAVTPETDMNPRVIHGPLAPSVDHSTFSDSASDSSFTVSGSVQGSVYGGIAVGDSAPSERNYVTIDGTGATELLRIGSSTTGSGVVVGGWSRNGEVNNNTVTISGASQDLQVDGIVYGGQINENIDQNLGSDAENNTVTLSGYGPDSARTTMRNNIYGAYSGGISNIIGNKVDIGSHVTVHLAGGIIAGGYDSVLGANAMVARGNEVIIRADATVEGTRGSRISIYGGRMHTGNASGNTVTVAGGTINYANIYGGQNNNISNGDISVNKVAVGGGTLNDVTIYGGWAGAGGNAHHNNVEIGGANTAFTGTVDVYGGRSGRGAAFGNIITINADATASVDIDTLYGGLVASGGNNAFSDNTLNKNSEAATIGTVRNVEYINFGYSADGNANIDVLDTTATGVVGNAAAGVTINTDANSLLPPSGSRTITFDGRIEGSGNLTKTGSGSLILTGNDNRIINTAGVTVQEGRLEIGNGAAGDGLSGNLVTPRYTVGTDTTGTAATLAYNRDDTVAYGGLIAGTDKGTLEQAGTGTLILTGDGSSIGAVIIKSGTLQLGNGGTSGSINAGGTIRVRADGSADGGVQIAEGATLAYSRSNAVTDGQVITGEGRVVQRGSGSLELTVAGPSTLNLYTGGTEIESGALLVGGAFSYNQATTDFRPANTTDPIVTNGLTANRGTSAGYITFTGTSGIKYAGLGSGRTGAITIRNSFRTQSGAGHENYVDLTLSPRVGISDIKLTRTGDTGGAFYVEGGTTMRVAASSLVLQDNHTNLNNDGSQTLNDLHVERGGTFNLLLVGREAVFKSGISGEGTLNLMSLSPNSVVQLVSDSSGQTYHMGETNLYGDAAYPIALNLARANSSSTHPRVEFTHTGAFSTRSDGDNAVIVIGDGIIQSDTRIDIGAGTNLIPYKSDILSGSNALAPDTLTLDAPNITLDNFTLSYLAKGVQDNLTNLNPTNPEEIPISNNGLLYLNTHQPLAIRDGAFNGIVDIMSIRAAGDFDVSGDYLIMRSPDDGAFSGMTNSDLSGLTPYVGGVKFDPQNPTLRGNLGGFSLGGDPDASDGTITSEGTGGYTNVWLTTDSVNSLNSLTMSWTGGTNEATPANHVWTQSDSFLSLQKDNSTHGETSFLGGDKVHVSGTDTFTVLLPDSSPSTRGFGGKIILSGLVVGQKAGTVDAPGDNTPGGVYTIAGPGGITANAASAFGRFLDPDTDDDLPLTPTGKLEKFGENALHFENTGGNLFMAGIEISGGTISFTRADQLSTGGAAGITFLRSATTLEARENIRLDRELVTIAPNVAGAFSVAAGKTLTLDDFIDSTGTSTGESVLRGAPSTSFNKTGPGILRLEGTRRTGPGFQGSVDVSGGTLHVAGNYGSTAGFSVRSSAILSGAGTLGGNGVIEAGGLLKPGGLEWSGAAAPAQHPLTVSASAGDPGNLDFQAGSGFAVRLAEYYGNGDTRYSDRVNAASIVTINPAASLAVEVDYFKLELSDSAYYTIIDAGAAPSDTTQKFAFNANDYLPRGVTLLHGWGLDGSSTDQYQIGGIRYTGPGYADISDGSHNETEIGRTIDWIVSNQDPGIADVVNRLTGDDERVLNALNQLTGDLSANALYMAFKEPWRHPFNRLEQALLEQTLWPDQSEAAPLHRPRSWIESSSRYEDVDGDGNARGFSLRRSGVAFGVDTRVAPRTIIGTAFRYTRPHLKQTNGDAYADDFELGLYGMTGLPGGLDIKMYVGYSHQEYEFDRTVSLPASPSGQYGALRENLDGSAGGEAVAASVELLRPLALREDFLLLPLIALDYESVWMDGYKESGGQSALKYEDASMERLFFRFGLKGRYVRSDRLDLKAWAQYATQIGGRDYPSVDARFAGATKPGQPAADIHGVHTGRQYVNLGLGANWNLGEQKDKFLYLNYDVNLNQRMTSHAGEFGFMMTW